MGKIIALVLFSFFLFIPSSSALLIEECQDRDYIAEQADYIIDAEVLNVETRWNEDKTLINTYNTLKVLNVSKGELEEDEILVITEGGEVGEVLHWVEDQAFFNKGGMVKVFLNYWEQDLNVVCGPGGVLQISVENEEKKETSNEREGVVLIIIFILIAIFLILFYKIRKKDVK